MSPAATRRRPESNPSRRYRRARISKLTCPTGWPCARPWRLTETDASSQRHTGPHHAVRVCPVHGHSGSLVLCAATILDAAIGAPTAARDEGVRTARARVDSAELRCHSPSRLSERVSISSRDGRVRVDSAIMLHPSKKPSPRVRPVHVSQPCLCRQMASL